MEIEYDEVSSEEEENKEWKSRPRIPNSLRWKVIGFLDAGKTQVEAAKFYGITQSAVSKILKKYKETSDVKSKKRPGCPLKLNEEQKDKICKLISMPFATCQSVATQMSKEIEISHDLVRNIAKERGYYFKKPKDIPNLTENHKKERLEYCEYLLKSNLSNFIFSDEAAFYLFRAKKKHWMLKDHKMTIKQINPNKLLMIWGAIACESKSKLYFKPTDFKISADTYCEILNENLKPFYKENMIFIQDNAPAHSAKSTQKWLEENKIMIKKHPAKSPDMNPIETIWGFMKNKLERLSVQNLDELRDGIQKIWDDIPQQIVKNTINHLKKVCIEVQKLKGEFFK